MLGDAKVEVTIPVVDLDRAKKFYGETLGLKPMGVDIPESELYEAGSGTLVYIYLRGATKADHTVASFEVPDVEETVKELKEKGVVFEEYDNEQVKTVDGVATLGDSKVAWFKDTEGNILAVGQK
ncbi:VOC family protein [Patescibacteria group bacterium]|nr:VOC family protein [Patescibacteria group bacterium]